MDPVLDRFREAHFWLHMLEQYYHSAEPFRWHLNVYIKAIKEVPDLILMSLQNEAGFRAWYGPKRQALELDPLIQLLSKTRDFVVHRGMLKLHSRGMIGITEGRGLKLGFRFHVDPIEDSDDAMDRFLHFIARSGDFFGMLTEDEDSMPCVQREWHLPNLEGELVDVCAQAWLRLGETITEVLLWLGTEPAPLSLDCRHSADRVQIKSYERTVLIARRDALIARDIR